MIQLDVAPLFMGETECSDNDWLKLRQYFIKFIKIFL